MYLLFQLANSGLAIKHSKRQHCLSSPALPDYNTRFIQRDTTTPGAGRLPLNCSFVKHTNMPQRRLMQSVCPSSSQPLRQKRNTKKVRAAAYEGHFRLIWSQNHQQPLLYKKLDRKARTVPAPLHRKAATTSPESQGTSIGPICIPSGQAQPQT